MPTVYKESFGRPFDWAHIREPSNYMGIYLRTSDPRQAIDCDTMQAEFDRHGSEAESSGQDLKGRNTKLIGAKKKEGKAKDTTSYYGRRLPKRTCERRH